MDIDINYLLLVLGSVTAFVFFIFLVYLADILYGFLIWLLAATLLGKEIFLLSIPGLPDIYLERIVFLFLIPVVLLMISREREALLPNTAVEYLMALLLLILVGSMWRTGFLTTRMGEDQPFSIFLTGFFFPFSFYYFGKLFLYKEERIRLLLWGLFPFYLYLIFIAYLEHFKVFELIVPGYISDPLKGIHFGRARGPFLNAPVNGWVMLTLFFSVLYLRNISESILAKTILFLALLFGLPPIFYTYTRAVWLAFLIAPIILMALTKDMIIRARFIMFPLILLILLSFFFWENLGSSERQAGGVMQISEVEDRIALFNISVAIFKEVPIFGVGFGRFISAIPYFAPGIAAPGATAFASQHNILFGILSEVGLLGAVPFVLILFFVFRYSQVLYRRLGEEGIISRNLVAVFWSILIVYLISASFIQTQYFIAANALTFLWVGMIVGLYQRQEEEPDLVEAV
jgi:O-antigen ligase